MRCRHDGRGQAPPLHRRLGRFLVSAIAVRGSARARCLSAAARRRLSRPRRRGLPRHARGKEGAMTTYVILGSWTEQGIRAIKDSPRRLDATKAALKEMGGEVRSFHMTMGDHDFVVMAEAPDDAVCARF